MNKKILLIDDDIVVQTILRDFFLKEGYLIDIETHGRSGINRFKNENYTLVLTDLRLPDINGLELLKSIQEHKKNTCCIVITAYPDVDTAISAFRYGAFDYIQKPLNLEEIKHTIENAFEYQRLTEENKQLLADLKEANSHLEKEKKQRLTALWEGAKIMGAVTSLPDFFNIILDVVSEVAQVKICSIMLLDKSKNKLIIKAARGLEDEIIKNTEVTTGEGISGWVVKNKETLFIKNIENDPRFKKRSNEKYLTKSLVSVPLVIQDEAVGVLNVNNKESGKEFTEEDAQILTALAKQISVTVESNRLYTDLKEANTQISELEEQLLASVKLASIGEIASITAHEINTPLTTMKGYLNLLPQEIENESFREKFIATMNHEIDRMTQITRRLLEFRTKESIPFAPIDIKSVIKQTLLFAEHRLNKNGIILHLLLPPDCPFVNGNFNQLEQVFLNLITNTIHAMPNGGELTIKTAVCKKDEFSEENHSEDFIQIIKTYSTPKWFELSFTDTGIGISKENLSKLFKPFFTTKKDGTGLGLSICRRIINEHSGFIDVASTLGKGTTFYVYLPLEK